MRAGPDGRPIVLKDADIAAAGARIDLVAKDLLTTGPVVGMYDRIVGTRRVFYSVDCRALTCRYSFIVARSDRDDRDGNTTTDIVVTGQNRAGLDRALQTISLRVPDRPAGVPLSNFGVPVE